jgi:hypothetical protein
MNGTSELHRSIWILYVYVGLVPLLGLYPSLGCRLFHSRMTPVTFVAALTLAFVGYAAFAFEVTTRDAIILATPLVQVTLVTVAYAAFIRFKRRVPKYVYRVSGRGLGWDRALAVFVFVQIGLPFLVMKGLGI